MATGAERRGENRQPLTLVVEYPDSEGLVSDYTENLSMGGTFVMTERVLPVGSEVRLLLSCPGLIEPILIRGTVRWTRGRAEDCEPGAGLQFTDYDEKTRRRLREVIAAVAAADPGYMGTKVEIFIVDDNRHVVNMIRDGLTLGRESLGVGVSLEFTTAADGQEALGIMLGEHAFDVALVDVYLPILDGASLIEKVRADSRTQFLPIIAMSAGGRDAADQALAAGADRFLSKPVRLREVVDAVRGVVPKLSRETE